MSSGLTELEAIYTLRTLLRGMERDLGLEELSSAERDILLVVRHLTRTCGQILNSDEIRQDQLVRNIPHASYHRALRSLVDRGMLSRPEGARAKRYVLSHRPGRRRDPP